MSMSFTLARPHQPGSASGRRQASFDQCRKTLDSMKLRQAGTTTPSSSSPYRHLAPTSFDGLPYGSSHLYWRWRRHVTTYFASLQSRSENQVVADIGEYVAYG